MRRKLWWALGATLGLTLLALWTQQSPPALIAAIEPRLREHAQSLDAVSALRAPIAAAAEPLPIELPRIDVEPARRDLFETAAAVPRTATIPAPTPMAAVMPTPPPAPAPQAPPLNLRYLGSMVTPDGQRLVYLGRGDTALTVATGDRLDEGYVVESIGAEGITLVYPPLGTKVTVPIPPAPNP